MKTHYELLGLEPTADADAIKKAFRREIARYHPDKVIHLGAEFQQMAATRAAELTVAYKTLTDPALREEYDASVAAGLPPPHMPQPPRPEPRQAQAASRPAAQPNSADDGEYRTPVGAESRFASERADRDVILKRAVTGRIIGIVEASYGQLDTPAVRGFDLAMVPVAKARFLGPAPPRVLVRVVDEVQATAVIEAHNLASRARVHSGKSPVVVLLFSRNIASPKEIAKAHDANARQRKAPDGPHEVAVVVVDTGDWSCRLPPNCSPAVRKLTDQICS
ncbi:MAG TPA: J domain-containing protein [Vicinamibacterales bacterium]|nr:J domain-containing protein [Vicinamibacterales bacterium]